MRSKYITFFPLLTLALVSCSKNLSNQIPIAPDDASPAIIKISEAERAPIFLTLILIMVCGA